MKTVRQARMEGRFYPASERRIFEQIKAIEKAARYLPPSLETEEIFGAVLPHAGHVYSGHQTVPFFHLLVEKGLYADTYLIVHPNHTGKGADVAVDPSDSWENSIGEVPLDLELAESLQLPFDGLAHEGEHSAEVLLPYLQYYHRERPFSIVPLCLRDQGFETAGKVATSINRAVSLSNRKIMLLASSDFSHFLSPEEGKRRDGKVLEAIMDGDPASVEKAVRTHGASVCGFGPIMTLMIFSQARCPGYRKKILARGHSGEVYPSPEVVDYISLLCYR